MLMQTVIIFLLVVALLVFVYHHFTHCSKSDECEGPDKVKEKMHQLKESAKDKGREAADAIKKKTS